MEVAAATKPTAMEAMVGAIAEAMATEDVEQEAAEVTPKAAEATEAPEAMEQAEALEGVGKEVVEVTP